MIFLTLVYLNTAVNMQAGMRTIGQKALKEGRSMSGSDGRVKDVQCHEICPILGQGKLLIKYSNKIVRLTYSHFALKPDNFYLNILCRYLFRKRQCTSLNKSER